LSLKNFQIKKTAKVSLSNFREEINVFVLQTLPVLGKKEAKIILMAASVAYNSAEYWENNYSFAGIKTFSQKNTLGGGIE